MATPSDIRAAWAASVWVDAGILAITTQIFDYDIISESKKDEVKFRFDQKINFFTYLTNRNNLGFEKGGKEIVNYAHTVSVNYYLEADHEGVAFNQVIDRMVLVESTVITTLGPKWSDTVDLYRLTDRSAKPELIELDGRATWLGQDVYTATERTKYT